MTKELAIEQIHICQDVLAKGIISEMPCDDVIGMLTAITQMISEIKEQDIDVDTIEAVGYKRGVRSAERWIRDNHGHLSNDIESLIKNFKDELL